MAKNKDTVTVEEMAEWLRLPSWDNVEEANVDHIGESGRFVYDEAIKEGDSEKKADEKRDKAELETAEEIYSKWSRAVESAAGAIFEDHDLQLEEIRRRGRATGEFEITPAPGKTWKDASQEIVQTIHGVGLVSVDPSEWTRAPRQFVLTRWKAMRHAPEVYGRSPAVSIYERAW